MRTCSYAWLYILGVHYAYVAYIHPTFDYAHYTYLPFSTAALFSTYLIAWLPVVVYRPSSAPAQAAVALIYALAYVPIQLSLLFTVERRYEHLIWIQLMLALSMLVLFLAARGGERHKPLDASQLRPMDQITLVAACVSMLLLVLANMGHMRIVSFEDVYDLRFESAALPQSTVSAYLISWLSYCFISYFYARGLVHRKWSLLLIGLAGSVLLYMATGAKSSILLLPITLGMSWLWGSGRDFLPRLLLALTLLIAVLNVALPDHGLGMWIKSIVLVRVVGTTGWVASKYLELFSTEGLTYYSHIGPLNALTGLYPFGDLSLGQVVGLAYSGSDEANFNGSFWASDGFAALGPIGILVVTPFVAGLLYVINTSMARLDPRFAVLWMSGFFMALLNVPLSTALLSGGGVIILAQAWWLSCKMTPLRAAGRTPSPPLLLT